MTAMTTRRCAALAALIWLAAAAAGRAADPSADVSAELSTTALPAGGRGMVAVVVDVHDGLHAQSHTPGNPDYIPLVVTAKPAPGLTLGEPRYPPGQDKNYPGLGRLNVYEDRVIVYLPVAAAADAAPGPVDVTGTVDLQACTRRACFPPESIPFALRLTVAAAGAVAQPNHPELFTGPDAAVPVLPPVPATKPATQPATQPTAGPTAGPTTVPAAAAAPPSDSGASSSGWFARHLKSGGLPVGLAGAFVIGILFNAVPCVLPVIPLKVLGFYEVSKHDRGRCLLLGCVFGAGIVAVFAALGVLIGGLHVIDWGKLFQQTWFIAAIVALLLAVAAGTVGLFDVALPTGVYGFNPRHDNVTGNFLFGMLTAVLSTPCTFGLLTALLTWTLTLHWPVAIAVFVVIGLGMAAPYVVLSAFPELARRFPRTGPWSDVVKKEMGLLMLAAAAFFAQPLLARAMPITAAWWVLFATVVLAAVYLAARAAQLSGPRWPTAVAGVVAAGMISLTLLAVLRLTRWPYQWQEYTPAALADATAAGHPVVIDFTATWCSTCHYLEANALHDRQVVSAVRDHRAVMLRADVTHGTEAGKPLLDQLNPTHTIPFTAVYAPHAAADARPAVLDGIYSASDLVQTLGRVSARVTARPSCQDP